MAEIFGIVGVVASVISAFVACDSFVKTIQDRRRQKKKLQLQEQDLAAENDFHKSAIRGKHKVEKKYIHGINAIGNIFAAGDGSYTPLNF